MKLSDSEIRLKVLESKGFAEAAGEKLRDELTDEQAALLAYTFFALNGFNKASAYAGEILYPILKQVLDSEVEDYKANHSVNDETDDCSAFKEHRNMNPEWYK